jgi:hypothetical protein
MPDGRARAIVVQTMWRTGGTYLVFALREQNPVALFYEPLHEDYSKYSKAEWDAFAAAGAQAPRGHPSKSFHYLSDYPFLPGAGVANHRQDFAYRGFVLGEQDEAPALADYLAGLAAHAARIGRRPLFKFCRGFLRQNWLRRALDPVTVYLARSPVAMAASYARLGGGAYFHSGYLRILSLNRTDPLFAALFGFVANAHREYAAADGALVASDQLMLTVSPETRRDVFLLFWALSLAAHADPSILTLDAAALGADAMSRARSAEALRRHTGLEVDLADAVPLESGPPQMLRFARPDICGPILRDQLSDSRLAVVDPPATMARQFEALAEAR